MKIKTILLCVAAGLLATGVAAAQDLAQSGFAISLKNGSTVRGRTLSRDDQTGKLRLAMSENSYAVIAPEDTVSIQSPAGANDSISIKLKGGSELRCKEFALNGEVVSVKLGTATRVEVRWGEIESISFAP
ncbi:MAG TPA: hypothetical protein VJZ26_05990 [Blastocatellia bacterium]|nr:hypothetical protein [Blastocatellia bacterium]